MGHKWHLTGRVMSWWRKAGPDGTQGEIAGHMEMGRPTERMQKEREGQGPVHR